MQPIAGQRASMNPIRIISSSHEASLKGRASRDVTCEACGAEFCYSVEREGVGFATGIRFLEEDSARKAARERAAGDLEHRLRRSIDVVPC